MGQQPRGGIQQGQMHVNQVRMNPTYSLCVAAKTFQSFGLLLVLVWHKPEDLDRLLLLVLLDVGGGCRYQVYIHRSFVPTDKPLPI